MKYLVRGYLPSFYSGFDIPAYSGYEEDQITGAPFCDSWRSDPKFSKFTVEIYHDDELIIEAHMTDGKHYVVGFALPEDSPTKAPDGGLLRDNWRYKAHVS
jgi:hypothetical protein